MLAFYREEANICLNNALKALGYKISSLRIIVGAGYMVYICEILTGWLEFW